MMNHSRNLLCPVIVLLLTTVTPLALAVGQWKCEGGEASRPAPSLVTDRTLERTGVQDVVYRPRSDFQTDFVMVYGVGNKLADRFQRWSKAGFVLHFMTGVAWGTYQDYLNSGFDGRKHWDEAQVDAAGNQVMHDGSGGEIPYMVPSIAFTKYLERRIQPAIDAGAVAVHLEEPEFWAASGFSEAFQREWQSYYHEPWQRPDASCDAQYRASKLKYYLYRRTLEQAGSA